eukprot:2311176-Rhodomonas_salina.1
MIYTKGIWRLPVLTKEKAAARTQCRHGQNEQSAFARTKSDVSSRQVMHLLCSGRSTQAHALLPDLQPLARGELTSTVAVDGEIQLLLRRGARPPSFWLLHDGQNGKLSSSCVSQQEAC